ncbi:MAG: hypothetical protein RL264_873 [Bacteroidota bacterium]
MNRVLLFFVLTTLLVGCRKLDKNNFEGPSLSDTYGPFTVLQDLNVGNYEVDFSTGQKVVFNMELSKNTNWVIRIEGENSGAVRTITGNDRTLSLQNAVWTGGANKYPSFNLEKAYITITFPNEEGSPIITDSVLITGLKQDQGYLITSFENGISSTWQQFNQSTVQGNINCDANQAAKGSCFYSWNGTVGWDWAIGSVTVKPSSGTFNLPASANNLFFNLAFKAIQNVGPQNSFLLFWFDEDDNGDGVFDPNTEDRFKMEYWSNTMDWDLISKKYADLKYDNQGAVQETNGNGLTEPSKLISINVFFLANPAGGNAKAYADHLIFTVNEPYQP